MFMKDNKVHKLIRKYKMITIGFIVVLSICKIVLEYFSNRALIESGEVVLYESNFSFLIIIIITAVILIFSLIEKLFSMETE